MMALAHMFIVDEPPHGAFLAQRFVNDFDDRKLSLYDEVDCPEDPDTAKIIDQMLDHGLDLRSYQMHVIGLFNYYSMALHDDDLVQELIDEKEHPDIHDVIEMVKHFNTVNPTMDVLSMIPLDLKGTMGYIIRGK